MQGRLQGRIQGHDGVEGKLHWNPRWRWEELNPSTLVDISRWRHQGWENGRVHCWRLWQ